MSLVQIKIQNNGEAFLVLNRPEKLNAFSKELCHNFLEALDQIEAAIKENKIRILFLSSQTPKAFCAGADLKERALMSDSEVRSQLSIQRQMMDRVEALPVPTVALIQGVAFGGGLELALACDFRVATEDAQMGLTELRLAIIPGSGGTQRLSRLIGFAKAKEMILLSKRVGASEALAMGLVNEVTKNIDESRQSFAEQVLATGPIAQNAAKRAILGGFNMDLVQALDHEQKCYEMVLKSKDRVEGLEAFLAKRSPQYQGV